MNWITTLLGNLNYPTIFLLMMLESTVIPVPSELVVSPAAYHAAAGNINIWLVILFSTLGADLGATINYVVAYFVGRPVVYRFANSRWGRLCLLNQQKVERSEQYFNDHGMVATVSGRLIIGIRHLISIPAGLAKMPYGWFLLYTTIGAGIWNCILAALGWYLHSIVPEDQLNDKIHEYSDYIKFAIIGIVAVAALYFFVTYYIRKARKH